MLLHLANGLVTTRPQETKNPLCAKRTGQSPASRAKEEKQLLLRAREEAALQQVLVGSANRAPEAGPTKPESGCGRSQLLQQALARGSSLTREEPPMTHHPRFGSPWLSGLLIASQSLAVL